MFFRRAKKKTTTDDKEEMTPGGQVKKRRVIKRKPGRKNPNKYFTQETQDSIVKYQNTEEIAEKHKIYQKEILPAFDALVENLINVYGFKVAHESKEDLKYECLEFLFMTVNKFDVTKGSKAFSYFNVVAKNWLTIKSKQNAKKVQQHISIDDSENISLGDLKTIEKHNYVPSIEEEMSPEEMSLFLQNIINGLEERAKTQNEKLTIDALREITRNLDDLEFLSKRAILLYIRQISSLNSKQLSMVLSTMKKHYKEIKEQLLDI